MSEQQNQNSSESSDDVDVKQAQANMTDDFSSIECDSTHEGERNFVWHWIRSAENLLKNFLIFSHSYVGRQLVHCILPINIETLFGLLFRKSNFFTEFHRNRKTTDLVQGGWEEQPDGTRKRVISLNVAISNAIAVGPKSAFVTETQIMRKCSKDGILYSVCIQSI